MKFFICVLIAIIALGVNSLPSESPNNKIPNWDNIIPDDLVVTTTGKQPDAHPKRDPKGRIFNGAEVTDKDDVKFQVRLIAHKKNDKNEDSLFGCGASIISPYTVLTAAHCVEKATEMDLSFGVKHTNDIGKPHIQTMNVKESAFRKPKTWNNVTLVDDIALIILPEPIKFSENVGSIALPTAILTECSVYNEKTVSIYGWGRINDAGTPSEMLKTSTVPVAKSKTCTAVYSWLFNEKMICADGSKYTGTCKGDSGGPLVENNGGKLTQIGIVSYGTKNCETTEPRVYTCVAAHLKFINDNKKM